MLPVATVIIVAILGLLLLSFVVYVASSSYMSVLVVLVLAYVLYLVLRNFGVFGIKTSLEDGMKIGFFETPPAPVGADVMKNPLPIEKNEVFYVSGNDYVYNEAPAVCAAYNAELASYDQVSEAFSLGAEWCGYGWSRGGMALFPTQESTWKDLQMEAAIPNKTACGRPGVNGGYFDLETKFGVNCYGIKPENMGTELPRPLPGKDTSAFQKMVDTYRSMLKKITVFPFNRNEWSKWANQPPPPKPPANAEGPPPTIPNPAAHPPLNKN